VVRHEYQQGKGNVIRRMFREIDAEVYMMVDGDDTYPADCAREMADLVINRNADMVIGDRLNSTYFTENKRPFHNFGNSIVRLGINMLYKSNIQDVMTGCRAFSYEFVKTFPVLSRGFEIETEMTIHALDKNMKLDHVVIPYRDRPEGSVSKLNTVSDGIKVLKTIVRMHRNYKPASFFGIIAAIIAVISTVAVIPLYICDVLPHDILTGFYALFMGSAVIALFAGLLLQNTVQKNKQDFELWRVIMNSEFRAKLEKNGDDRDSNA